MTEAHDPPRVEVLPLEKAATSDSQPANKIITDKNGLRRKLPRSAWRPGQSGNPKGRPAEGQSWGAIIEEVTNLSPDEIARLVGKDNDLGRAFLQMPPKVQMRYLIVARVMASLMFEPSKGLFDSIMERTDGKIQERVDITSNGETIDHANDRDTILRKLDSIAAATGAGEVPAKPDGE